jgi:acyl-CoA thioester hydrolase
MMSKISYIEDMEEWAASFSCKHQVKVRFSEIDMFGHLNNTVPFTYFEEARIEFFNRVFSSQNWIGDNSDTIPVVADIQCDFLKQIFFNEKIDVYVKADKVGNTSVDLHYMGVIEDGSIGFTGRGTVVQISKKTGRPIPWSEEKKQLMTQPAEIQQQ